MSHHQDLYFPSLTGTLQKNKCCCNNPEQCSKIRSGFRSIGDIRASVNKFPNPTKRSQQTKKVDQSTFWSKRANAKLGIQGSPPQTNNSKDIADKPQTRGTKAVTAKVEKYIALWHYHPQIFRPDNADKFWMGRDMKTMKKIVSINTLQDTLNVNITGLEGGYDSSDVIDKKNEMVCVLPCYAYNDALDDLVQAKQGKLEYDQIQETLAAATPRRPRPTSRFASSPIGSRSRNSGAKRRVSDDFDVESAIQKKVRRLEDEADLMESKIANLQREVRRSNRTIGRLQSTSCGSKEFNEHEVLTRKGSGLNRISISSKQYHRRKENGELAKQLFGFDSFDETIVMIEALFDVPYVPPVNNEMDTNGLTEMEQIMLTLVWTNLLLSYELLGILFGGLNRNTVSKYINRWIPVLGERGDMLSDWLPFLNRDVIEALEPYSYKDLGLKDIAGILDGKDFPTETCRIDRLVNCAQHSNKLHTSAFRILTWSLPMGAVIHRTPAFLGRSSEKALMNFWGKYGCLVFPLGMLILGDKGFDNTAAYYVNYNTTLHPAFLTDPQFNLSQVGHNVEICQKRYTCEVVYSRVTNVEALKGIIPRRRFSYMESLIGWAHGRANICYDPLQAIERDKD